jgi:hypothetical protein
MKEAGRKLRFWTNVGVVVGFMSFSLPITVRRGIRYRFLKGMIGGTLGVIACAPVRQALFINCFSFLNVF